MRELSVGLTIDDIRRAARGPCLVIAAHPDDEVLGASTFLMHRPDTGVLYVTDGAPTDEHLWAPGAPGSRHAYAALRRAEADAALAVAGVGGDRIRRLGFVDQEVSFDLVSLSRVLLDFILELRPKTLIVHPYEGGHPDHDACAFAASAATSLAGDAAPTLLEMTSYHGLEGALVTGRFIPGPSLEHVCPFTIAERDTKVRMLACYESQREILAAFGVEAERFRRAPAYDFTKPPHPGPLHYEALGWRMSSAEWCELAREALRHLTAFDRRPEDLRERGENRWA